MKIYFSRKLNFCDENERLWTAKNGATRRSLVIVNKLSLQEETNEILGKVGYLDKGNHSFIFLNSVSTYDHDQDPRIVGIYLCSGYGYTLVEGKELLKEKSNMIKQETLDILL